MLEQRGLDDSPAVDCANDPETKDGAAEDYEPSITPIRGFGVCESRALEDFVWFSGEAVGTVELLGQIS